MIRAALRSSLITSVLAAWPGSQLAAQPVARLAAGPFAGVAFGAQSQPLFGIGVVIPLPRDFAGTVAASAVRYTGAIQLEAGARWPSVRDRLLTPYVGAAGCLIGRILTEDLRGPNNWNVGVVGFAGLEVQIRGFRAFVEGVGVATGPSALQVRGGLRLQGP